MKESDGVALIGRDIPLNEVSIDCARIDRFMVLGHIKNGGARRTDDLPYALITLKLYEPPFNAKLAIDHKLDFLHLWEAYKKRGVSKDEEVLVTYNPGNYKYNLHKIFPSLLPKLVVWICPKGAFKIIHDYSYRPELRGTPRYRAKAPITEYKPGIMKF